MAPAAQEDASDDWRLGWRLLAPASPATSPPSKPSRVRRGRLEFKADSDGRLTHYMFRYPAKFHPPLVRRLLADYTQRGHRVLDPFCGSGTLLVEAAIAGRHATGTAVDPGIGSSSSVRCFPPRAASCSCCRTRSTPDTPRSTKACGCASSAVRTTAIARRGAAERACGRVPAPASQAEASARPSPAALLLARPMGKPVYA
jgi:DNA methylase